MSSPRLIWITVLVLGLSLIWMGSASAQQPTPSDDEVNAIARQLFCPVCQNTPLDVCPTQACQQWRDLIRQMLAEGKSADYIKQYFVVHYGARVLAEPPRTGFNWLIYVVLQWPSCCASTCFSGPIRPGSGCPKNRLWIQIESAPPPWTTRTLPGSKKSSANGDKRNET